MFGHAFFVVGVMAGKIDELALLQACFFHVLRIHENHAPAVVDAAITIIEAVDRGVELIVRANRHHDVLAGPDFVARDLRYDEFRLSDLVIKYPLVARLVRQIKDVAMNAFVEILETRDDVFDVIANAIVVRVELFPIDGRTTTERCARQPADDCDFAQ